MVRQMVEDYSNVFILLDRPNVAVEYKKAWILANTRLSGDEKIDLLHYLVQKWGLPACTKINQHYLCWEVF